jgi:hypothetical protein
MNSVDINKGLSPTFFAAGAGVILLAIINVVTTGLGGSELRLIPELTFDGSVWEFMLDYLDFFFTTTLGLVVLSAMIVFYITGTYYVQKSFASGTEHQTASTMRGLLIGLNSGMNFLLAYRIYSGWDFIGETAGLVIALALFALNILAALRSVSRNDGYQGIVGWLCWLAPMSWPVLILGLVLLGFSALFGLIGLLGVNFLRVGGAKGADGSVEDKVAAANWATGTFFIVGGLASNANFRKTAFDMGNVGFIHRRAAEDFRAHEAGHNLNLFVFGWIVHLIGAFDENIVGYHDRALMELLAESHDGASTDAKLEMWP